MKQLYRRMCCKLQASKEPLPCWSSSLPLASYKSTSPIVPAANCFLAFSSSLHCHRPAHRRATTPRMTCSPEWGQRNSLHSPLIWGCGNRLLGLPSYQAGRVGVRGRVYFCTHFSHEKWQINAGSRMFSCIWTLKPATEAYSGILLLRLSIRSPTTKSLPSTGQNVMMPVHSDLDLAACWMTLGALI